MSSKDCLFFSTQCQHSMELLKLLDSMDLKQMFLLICIDNQKYKIPQFVDRVPMIYKQQERRVLVDKMLVDYISQLISYKNQIAGSRSTSSPNNNVNDNRSKSNEAIELGGYNEISSGISDSFGFLSDQDSLHQLNTQYDYIASLDSSSGNQQMSQQQVRPSPTPSRDRGEPERVDKGSRFDQQQFESLLSSRDKDIKDIFQNQKQ